MRRVAAVIGGGAVGVAAMLGILQPWRREPRPSSSTSSNLASRDLLQDAQAHLDAGRTEEARRLLIQLLAVDRESARVHLLLALVELKEGNITEAQGRLSTAALIDPYQFEIPLIQGHIEMVGRNYRSAIHSYTKALNRQSDEARALSGRATARYEVGEFAGAIEDATGALRSSGHIAEALFARAAAYGRLGRWEEAVGDWTAYLVKRPTDAQAWTNRGNALERLGRHSAAVTDWQQAVKLDESLSNQLNPLINASK